MSKRLRISLLCGLVLFAFSGIGLFGHRSNSRKALQQYKAQLRAQGEKLTYAELTASRIHSPNNSLAIITNTANQLRRYWFQPGTMDFMPFDKPGRVRIAWKEAQPRASTSSPGGPVTWVELTEQVDAAKVELETIQRELQDPPRDMGLRTNIYDGPAPFVAMRNDAQWLAGSTLVELHRANLEGALKNLEALIALAQMNGDEPTLVGQMIRVAIAGLGSAVTWQALQADGWSEAQLKRLQKRWEQVDLLAGLETGFTGERTGGQDFFETLRQSNNSRVRGMLGTRPAARSAANLLEDYIVMPAYRLTSVDDDQLLHLKNMQQAVESVRSLRNHRPWNEVKAKHDKNFASLQQISGPFQRYRYLFSLLAIPNFERALQTCIRNETQRQMTLAATALKRYQLHHGKPAASLEALVPEFLSSVPWDYLGGQPLHYRLNTDGTFILYSVGEDGQDNNGDPNPPQAPKAPDLWSGRDAVWPQPAQAESTDTVEP